MQYHVWTDGACSGNPGVGAWAAMITDGINEPVELGQTEDHTTNNLMELRAVERAIEFIDKDSHIVVYTDSNLVVNWMLGTYARKNAQCRAISEHIDRLIVEKGLSVEWVRIDGHSGDEMNERADRLAKKLIRLRKSEIEYAQMARIGGR